MTTLDAEFARFKENLFAELARYGGFVTRRFWPAIITLLATAHAMADETFYDPAGHVVARARTDPNGVTHFSDHAGRTTGIARTDLNGTRRFYDAAGRDIGRVK